MWRAFILSICRQKTGLKLRINTPFTDILHLKSHITYIYFQLTLTLTAQTGVLSSLGRLTNQCKGSSKGENAKLSTLGSAWRVFMWWMSKRRWALDMFFWLTAPLCIPLHESVCGFSLWTCFPVACTAWPALQWALLGPQPPWGGGRLAHPVVGVWWRGRRHPCEQVTQDLFKTSKKIFAKPNSQIISHEHV